MDFNTFIQSRKGAKVQMQIKTAHEHIRQHLAYAEYLVDLGSQGAYLAVDDDGQIVCRYCSPGQCPGEQEHGEH